MAKKITETFTYDADVESVYALITDQAFRKESAENQEATDIEVTVSGGTVSVVRTQESDMPDFIKKLTGPTVKVKQTEAWGDAAADGSRTADVKVSIVGQPAEMTGTAKLTPAGGGTEFTLDGEVKVSIPLLGKKIEPEVAKAIIASLREEVAFGTTKI